MSDDSTRKPRSRKAAHRPKKPYPDFPLTPHASGAWQKKIRGKIHYFGKWAKRVNGKLVRVEGDGWQEALDLYKAQADDLHAGRTPRAKTDGLTVADLCNHFLTAKQRKQSSGEITSRMFAEYKEITDLLVATFGKARLVEDLAADDFGVLRAKMTERWGPVRLGNAITRAKGVFKYADDNTLIPRLPRYGSEFCKPGESVLRRHRAQGGEKMLEAEQLHLLLGKATPQMKAMILLGVNCGFGNHDIATLPLSALDLEGGWIDFPRPKTGIGRKAALWPETVAALRDAIACRPQPRQEGADCLVFLTSRGRSCVSGELANAVGRPFAALLKQLSMHQDGTGFYVLRHTFRTIADAARDPVAVDIVMGHADPSMGAHYRERVEDSRLQAVADHVRQWLFGSPPDDKKAETKSADNRKEDKPAPLDKKTDASPSLRLYVG